MARAGEPVSLSANDIHLSFGPNAVLRGVDIDAPAGTTTAVIGPSGSGKSTLLRTLNRLYEPERGDILLDGRSVLADNPDRLRQRIGMVFQQFNLFPHRSVLDNVTLAPRKLKRLDSEQARALGLAQLGPISAWMDPRWISTCFTSTAVRPPKRRTTLSAMRIGSGFGTRPRCARRPCLAASSSGWRSRGHSRCPRK